MKSNSIETKQEELIAKYMAKGQGRKAAKGVQEVGAEILSYVQACGIRGLQKTPAPKAGELDFEFRFEISWRVDCTLYVQLEVFGKRAPVTKEMRKDNVIYEDLPLKVHVNWGSTTRTLTEALASVELYRKVALLGAEIESRWGGECIRRVRIWPAAD